MRTFISGAFLLVSSVLSAQPYFDVVSLQAFQTTPDHLISEDKFDVKTEWYSLQLNYPLQFRNKSVFAINAGYDRWQLNPPGNKLKLQTAYLPLTYVTPSVKNWRFSLTFIPRLNGEISLQQTGDAFQAGGAFIASNQLTARFRLKGGLYYNREFFGNYYLPLIGCEWKAGDRLYIFGLIPNNLIADYRLTSRVHAGFSYKGITTSFRLKDENDYDFIRMEEGQLKVFADIYIAKYFVLNLSAGHTAARAYGFGYIYRKSKTASFNDGTILQAGLYYRLWL